MRLSIKILFLFILSINFLFAQQKKKVACIGDSVTKGSNLAKGKTYPEQLQQLLGDGYEVRNFGRNGATLLEKGHNPYLKSEELEAALAFKPDMIVISLGLNDTDPRNLPNYQIDFQRDYNKLISLFENENPKVEVFVCEISPIFSGHPRFLSGTRDWYWDIKKEIEAVAVIHFHKLVDLYSPLAFRIDLFDDYLHPSEQGAEIIAKTIFDRIVPVRQKLSVHESIGSHMVLQRNQTNRIKGKANAGQTVFIEMKGGTTLSNADKEGEWAMDVDAMPAGGPYRMKIRTDQDSIILEDILFGDVFLASGQSNMAFPLKEANGSKELIKEASKHNNIRIFKNKVLKETNNEEWDEVTLKKVNDLEYFSGNWEKLTAENAANFSAIAFSFAEALEQEMKVPIGIIELAVGGSNTESWIPRRSLEEDPLLATYIHGWRKSDFIQDFCRNRAEVNLKKSKVKNQRHPYEPAYNFEAGYNKWKDTSLKGVLWYQGESNAHNVELHEHLFKTLIDSWRANYKPFLGKRERLPFYTVQLSSIDRPSWPKFRDSQRKLSNELKDVYMAISSDVGDSLDVHPREKLIIGNRLANLVLKHQFGKDNNADSPQPIYSYRKERQHEIRFSHAKQLRAVGSKEVIGFQAKDENGNLVDLRVVEIKGNSVILENPKGLTEIYYGYKPFSRANLVNEEGVPVSTFSIKR
ncbi:GDSL-type esterase/lipase family protein [Sphingobacterium sp. WM]|uniref:GDSL-type esterase/lipase family protein n=1 Tax=Sphingobacterium sp. WM TaxID=3031802 RepID=UPI00240E77A5|nr:GDSL-type esterase/lipase family protein [Sphingobacterium sp. WM]WFB63219.1 GDSL-type esterase/lipase family protein [Sphingobacterium sp. WM]